MTRSSNSDGLLTRSGTGPARDWSVFPAARAKRELNVSGVGTRGERNAGVAAGMTAEPAFASGCDRYRRFSKVSGPGNSVGGECLAVEFVERALRAASALRGGVEVELDPEHVAAAVRSERHLRLDGRRLAGFAPLSRYWRAADGWVRTHANYPWHRAALLSALHTGPKTVGEAIAGLSAAEVEARVIAGPVELLRRPPVRDDDSDPANASRRTKAGRR